MSDPDPATPPPSTVPPAAPPPPPPPPRRRVSVRVEIEADSLQIAREALARASARFSVGAPSWGEASSIATGDLVVESDPTAPTGQRYEDALERWRSEIAGGEASTARPARTTRTGAARR